MAFATHHVVYSDITVTGMETEKKHMSSNNNPTGKCGHGHNWFRHLGTKSCLTIIIMTNLTGCSLGIGSEEYGCSGLPKGVQCKSTREVYLNRKKYGEWTEMNLPADYRSRSFSSAEGISEVGTGKSAGNSPEDKTEGKTAQAQGSTSEVIIPKEGNAASSQLKELTPFETAATRVSYGHEYAPDSFIRTRDDIMITVINPHEDTDGNLHDRSVIYTSLHNGTWGISGSSGRYSVKTGHTAVKGNSGGAMPYLEVKKQKKRQDTKQ